LNNNLLSELVQKINRLKETDSSNISKNVISVGNSIQTNTSFAAASPVQCVNDMLLASAEIPFGGIKESGFGREGGSLGILDYLVPKYTKFKIY
jgi:succinate-semialdehyde dehydrogenase/glutarate-semialdehyde dehydrogenase